MKKNLSKVIEIFSPDESGVSRWVSRDELEKSELNFGNNGNGRRGIFFNVAEFEWEVRRGGGRKILALRTSGLNEKGVFDQKINKEIRYILLRETYCNISMMPVAEQDKEIDHRFGHKSHPKYVELYTAENQQTKDFQLLHRVHNQMKRQMCKECIDTRKRPPHPIKGYALGSSQLDDDLVCEGCYLANPEMYR